jgi:hypothetical protein
MKTTRANCLPNFDQARKLLEQFREDDELVTTLLMASKNSEVVKTVLQTNVGGEIRHYMLHNICLSEERGGNVVTGYRYDSILKEYFIYEFPKDYPCLVWR